MKKGSLTIRLPSNPDHRCVGSVLSQTTVSSFPDVIIRNPCYHAFPFEPKIKACPDKRTYLEVKPQFHVHLQKSVSRREFNEKCIVNIPHPYISTFENKATNQS